jgi:hypothetical protein
VTGFDVSRVELPSTLTMQKKNANFFFQLAGMNIFSAYLSPVLAMSGCINGFP